MGVEETKDSPPPSTAATVDLANTSNDRLILRWVGWSYDKTPTNGKLTVKYKTSGTVLMELDVTAAGPNKIDFGRWSGVWFPVVNDEDIRVTLAAAGLLVTGSLAVTYQ